MAKTPEAALKFMDALVPGATAKAASEAKDIQDVIDAQKGGFRTATLGLGLLSEQVRKAKYGLDESAVKPYFELATMSWKTVCSMRPISSMGSLPGTQGHSGISAGCARLRGLKRGRQAAGTLLLRLLQA